MTIETIRYPTSALQPGCQDMQIDLVGAGASAPVSTASKDNNNRLVSATARSGAGAYTVTFSQYDRKILGVYVSFETAANSYQLGSYSFSAGVLSLRFSNAAGTAADLAASDIAHLTIRWKHGG